MLFFAKENNVHVLRCLSGSVKKSNPFLATTGASSMDQMVVQLDVSTRSSTPTCDHAPDSGMATGVKN